MSSKTLVLPFDADNYVDRSTILCLACSSSLPPLKSISSFSLSYSLQGHKRNPNAIFITNCCQRPICPSCIAANPRLARYDPCLACLGGVGVVASRSALGLSSPTHLNTDKSPRSPDTNYNLDASVRDEDTFVLGDDEDDEDVDGRKYAAEDHISDNNLHPAPPPPYEPTDEPNYESTPTIDTPSSPDRAITDDIKSSSPNFVPSTMEHLLVPTSPLPESSSDEDASMSSTAPYKYYINRADTLHGISLRFGVDSHEICKLNNLPPSVVRTAPQLLHTRAFILLPPGAKTTHHSSPKPTQVVDDKVRQREAHLVRERAGKRLQTLTKEVDWRVAKAYVALVDDPEEREAQSAKRKEMGSSGPSGSAGQLEALAVQRYLDDDEWEEEERRAGRGPEVRAQHFPFSLSDRKTSVASTAASSMGSKGW